MGWYYVLLIACIPLIIVPSLFIYNQIYEDGIVGRFGLISVSASAAFVWIFHWAREAEDGFPIALPAMMAVSFAVFLVWHLFRFHSRVLRKKREQDERACSQVVEAP